MRIRRRQEQGLTLIEILLAAALTAVVVGMSVVVMTSAQALWADQEERSAAARDGWLFLDKLCRELREAVPPAQLGDEAEWRGTSARQPLLEAVSTADWPESSIEEMKRTFRPEDLEIADGTIRFPTLRVMAEGRRPVPGLVEYSLERDASHHVVGIARRSAQLDASPSATKHVGGQSPSVAERVRAGGLLSWPTLQSLSVVSLGFKYLGTDGRWQTEWNEGAAMPRAVRITVGTLVRPSRNTKVPVVAQFTTMVYLPADSRISQ